MTAPESFAATFNVSRETLNRLTVYAETLAEWNARFNLVSPATLADVWMRHIWDSAQLAPLVPQKARTLADIGSGAGFPGLVLALLLEARVKVTLFEATRKKCDFLTAAAKKMALAVEIRNSRIEECPPEIFDVITARACAPLPKLLGYCRRSAGPHSVCLFLKGENAGKELADSQKNWRFRLATHPSQTHNGSQILEISQLKPFRSP